MAEIVNLRRARKEKARKEAEREAARNRAVHGRAKADKNLSRKRGEKLNKDLDAHKRDPKT